MRNRILILLATAALLTAVPLFAQTADEPQVEHSAELQASTDESTASASAEASATTGDSNLEPADQESMDAEIEADANAEAGIDGDRELPETAGFLPLLGLLGLASLFSALGLRVLRSK